MFWPMKRGHIIASGFGPRDGGFHYGTDFGWPGGSAGLPVYSPQAGTVDKAGPASGFGWWVCIDHPDSAGGGYTVLGHIIPEVAVGQRVEAGQRVARINPDSSTNGGVPPHVHVERHRYTWAPPGLDRLDPLVVLAGAEFPEETPMPPTTFGVDISNHQAGLDLGRVFGEGYEFVIAKVSEGDGYRDPYWPGFRDATLAAGKILVGYHYVRADSGIEEQAQTFAEHLGDKRIPAMLDFEAGSGGIGVFHAVRAAVERRGVRVALSYLPRWYWQQIGSPSLSGIPPLMASDYGPGRSGFASAIYPGPGDRGWQPYGGTDVAILQFSEKGAVAGRSIDIDAFRGTPQQLRAFLSGDLREVLMSLSDDELSKRFPSRSKYRTTDEPIDTLAGMVLNVDARIHEQWVEAEALKGVPAQVDLVRREAARGDAGAQAVLAKLEGK